MEKPNDSPNRDMRAASQLENEVTQRNARIWGVIPHPFQSRTGSFTLTRTFWVEDGTE